MNQDRNTRIAEALDRLFRTYEQSNRNVDPGDLARERIAKAKVYFEAVSIYEAGDVEQAVTDFNTGSVPGHNPAYPPTAPQVGSACRRAMEARLDSEYRDRLSRPALPPPDIEKTPESRARVKAQIEALMANLEVASEADVTDSAMLRRAADRHDSYFIPTLKYTAGDPDADSGDMGERQAG